MVNFLKIIVTLVSIIFISACGGGGGGQSTTSPPQPSLTSIIVTGSQGNLAAGSTVQLHATGTYSDGTSQDLTNQVTWSVNSSNLARVNTSGLLSALTTGTVTISASLVGIQGTASFSISAATLTSITISPSNQTLVVGLSQNMRALGLYSDGTSADISTAVTWTSSNTSVATINSTGVLQAVTAGSTTISATSGTITSNTNTTIIASSATGIVVTTPNPWTLVAGSTGTVTFYETFSNGTTGSSITPITYASSNSSTASVSSTGVITARSAGSVVITVSDVANNLTANFTLNVSAATLQSLSISQTSPSVGVGSTYQLNVIGTYSDASTRDLSNSVTWTSASNSTATVSPSGLVTGVAVGNVNITASLNSISTIKQFSVVASSLSCPAGNGGGSSGLRFYDPQNLLAFSLSNSTGNALVVASGLWGAQYSYSPVIGLYTGSISGTLWAVSSSYSGASIISGYKIGTAPPNFTGIGAYSATQLLAGGYSYTSILSSGLTRNPPPGQYCIVETLNMYAPSICPLSSDGYCTMDWLQYPRPFTFN